MKDKLDLPRYKPSNDVVLSSHVIIGTKMYILTTETQWLGIRKELTYLSNGKTKIFIGSKTKSYQAKLVKWHKRALESKKTKHIKCKVCKAPFLFIDINTNCCDKCAKAITNASDIVFKYF